MLVVHVVHKSFDISPARRYKRGDTLRECEFLVTPVSVCHTCECMSQVQVEQGGDKLPGELWP